MKLMRNKFLPALAAAVLVLSCTTEAEYAPVYELGSPQSAKLVTVSADGGTVSCEVFANGDYTVTLNDAWIRFAGEDASLRSKTLSGDGTFGISLPENPDLTRFGSLTLQRGTRTVTIEVRQRGRLSSDAGIVASLANSTPSSLTFSWYRDVDGETGAEADYTYPYRFSLYRDAAATDLLVSYETEGSATCWSKRQPCFAFGGLTQGTTYYFLCEQIGQDGEGTQVAVQHSDLLEASTPDFTPVTIPENPAAVGDVILAEDWSLCPWYSDYVSQSAGFLPAEELRTALISPAGVSPEGTVTSYSSESELFSASYHPLVDESRLGGWSKHYDHDITGRPVVYMHAGHVKIGGSSYTGHLVTPQLTCIPDGYEATLEVKVRLSRFASDSDMTYLGSADGTFGRNDTYGNYFKPSSYDSEGLHFAVQGGWRDYTLTLSHVRNTSRLILGPDFEMAHTGNGASQHRLMVGDITVKITALTQVQDVSVLQTRYSDATIGWTQLDDASVTGYELWLDGTKYAEAAATESSLMVQGLASGSAHTATVKAIRNGSEATESKPVSFTTKDFRCYKAFSERICVEWEDLVPSDAYVNDTYARAYQIEVYKDEALSDRYISAYSYNGSGKDEGAFPGKPSTGICGKTGGTSAAYYNAFPTRATAGFLEPSTTYWFRVRSVDGIQVANLLSGGDVTLTNVAGTSEWSLPLAVTTLPARTPSEKEVIFQGFDHLIGADWNCYAAGIGPKLENIAGYGTFDADSYSGDWCMFSMYSYTSMQMPLWGLSSPVEGEGAGYFDSPTLKYGSWNRENNVDAAGWHYDSHLGSLMGQLHLCDMVAPASAGIFFGTPQLEANLTEEPQACTVSFGAFATGAGYTSTASKDLYIRVWHADTGLMDDGVKVNVPVRYIPSKGATSSNYMFDTSFYTVSAEVQLKKGDAVIVANQTASNRIIVDDFLIELK